MNDDSLLYIKDRADAASSLRQTRQFANRVLNCVPSLNREDDWGIDTAIDSGVLDESVEVPTHVDLREDWWTIRDQDQTGACVGFASADGVLRWHLVKAGLMKKDQLTSPRFIWMANKETDEITDFPTSFIESAGTQTKRAMLIALRYGCLLERDLPMKDGSLWRGSTAALYSQAARFRIESFYNLGTNLDDWRRWLANRGPILTRLSVDDSFMSASNKPNSRLKDYNQNQTHGGHAVAIVGYGPDYFIIRNSWGTGWGHGGFAYASIPYTAAAFTESYGVVLSSTVQPGHPETPIPTTWDTNPEVLTEPRFEGITIELSDSQSNPSTKIASIAREVLGKNHGWRIEPVHKSEPNDFDLLPPLGLESEITVSEAWNYTHALRNNSDIQHAEPSFVVFQDNDPNLLIPGSAQLGRAADASHLSVSQLEEAGLPIVDENWRDWSPLFIRAHEAWKVKPRPRTSDFNAGKSKGEGIRIGHPDSGYRKHKELWNPDIEPRQRLLKELDRDFVDNDLEPMTDDGSHGLGTASVIMSYEPNSSGPSPLDEITGTAPRADIVPMRVAKVRPVIPTPVLLRSGMIRLRKAIDYGVEEAGCHVFSISLGWLWNRSLHKALKRAVKNHNAIIVAAAGNHVPFVVWPANYKETICVGACNYRGGKWSGSSRGSRVDVTAPGEDVWKADFDEGVKTSSGTSYATASVAGLAALWLAHHGRDYLIDRYDGTPLSEVFRLVLKRSCVKPSGWNIRKWGSGIVNAKALLEAELPGPSSVANASRRTSTLDEKIDSSRHPVLMETFEKLSPEDLERRIAAITGETDKSVAIGMEDEIAFHILTNPIIRSTFGKDDDAFGDDADLAIESWRDLSQKSDSLQRKK